MNFERIQKTYDHVKVEFKGTFCEIKYLQRFIYLYPNCEVNYVSPRKSFSFHRSHLANVRYGGNFSMPCPERALGDTGFLKSVQKPAFLAGSQRLALHSFKNN